MRKAGSIKNGFTASVVRKKNWKKLTAQAEPPTRLKFVVVRP